MPKFLEQKLKKEYAGEDPAIPYKVMNKLGAMHGSKITAKGRRMEEKHEKDMKHSQSSSSSSSSSSSASSASAYGR